MSHGARSLLAGCVLLMLGGSGGRAAQEKQAPLEDSKRELKTLQNEQALQKSGAVPAGESLHLAVPRLQAGSESPATPPVRPTNDIQPKTPTNDWLLNGVETLERHAKFKAAGATKGSAREEDGMGVEGIDLSDPAYLLKTYEIQRMKDAMPSGLSATANPGGVANPLDAYLDAWLMPAGRGSMGATSVSPQMLMPGVSSKTEGPGAGLAGQGALFGRSRGLAGTEAADANGSRKAGAANPYLESTPAQAARPAGASSAPPPAGLAKDALSPPGTPPKTGLMPPADQTDEKRPKPERNYVPPSLRDDKKYFPQLKHF